ncbi:MAG: carboxypeptidase-like regulatory domain-containing protein [Mucilaginibacter sp.]|uniref:carboxypeptidase-like regulatory domain-containing protein n=1 Tax=Mucilaginibacter sp. TaxID=1882438 RepID=UPI00326429F7
MKTIVLFLLFIPSLVIAQSTITGKVLNASDKTPVPFASVFLSNSLVGAKTNDDGSFTLNNVKAGQYDLVISFIGFETHHQTVTVSNNVLALPDILITPKNTTLKEVTIGPPDPKRDQNLQVFINEFLGHSVNAQNCTIKNTDDINLSYNAHARILSASSDDFLIIENKALGYIVKYQLGKFIKNYAQGFLYYEGSVLFEEMKGKPAQQKRWLKARQQVYKGSDMHFFRSIYGNNLQEQGFKVLRLIRKTNPARPPDSLIRAKLRLYGPFSKAQPGWADSAKVWSAKYKLPKALEYLVSKPMPIADYVIQTDNKAILALKYTDYLYVIYTKRSNADNNGSIYHPLDMPTYPSTIIGLNLPYAVFDSNGILGNPTSTTVEGDWAGHGVADLLPVDYEPLISKP